MKARKYTREFKEEAANLVLKQGYSCVEASRSLGVSDSNISRWVCEYKEGESLVKGKGAVAVQEKKELEQLRKEIKRLQLEREILKKAAAFFANEVN